VKIQVYTNCMRLEIETKMDSVKKTVTPGTGPRKCVPSGEVPHPVLIVLDTRGRFRDLWEYFKTYSDKTPVYGRPPLCLDEFGKLQPSRGEGALRRGRYLRRGR